MPAPETINIIVLIITCVLIILILRDRLYGLIAYLSISISKPGLHYPVLAKVRFEMIVAVIVLSLILLCEESRGSLSLTRNRISRNVFIFFLVVILSMTQAIDFPTAFGRAWEFAKVYAFYFMIISLIRKERDLKYFLWAFGILMVWIGYEPICNFLSGVVRVRGEATYAEASEGRGSGHVALGIYLLHGLVFLWYLTVANKSMKGKFIGLFFVGICLVGLIIAGSRGALVGLAVTVLLMSYFSEHRVLFILGGTVMFFVALSLMGAGYQSYMGTILDMGQSDSSAQNRIAGLKHGIEILAKRPILGVGPGCYPVARKLWFGWGLWSHNMYGQLAGDLGLIGIGSWSIFFFSYIKKCFDLKNSLDHASFYYVVLMALIVSNFVSLALGFFAHMLYGYFWYMSAGITVVIEDLVTRGKYGEGINPA